MSNLIPFSKPYLSGNEIKYIQDAYERGHLSGDGFYTKKASDFLEKNLITKKALITHSCTAALEMAAILIDIKEGDEVIMPSYTFVSTANAFVLRGATPVFVDIRFDTLNLDENLIIQAITPKTRAIVVVHYAGVPCEMDSIMKIAREKNLIVIEDAAQGLGSKYKDKHLGTIGDIGCLSFHETKNIISGEGGAILLNNEKFIKRAEIIREKGTNRSEFFRGFVDKYTWVDIGSSYLASELISAFLYAQLENLEKITNLRKSIWNKYNKAFTSEIKFSTFRFPSIPNNCIHNAHMYYIVLRNLDERTYFISQMKKAGLNCVFHYVPLHNSPAGIKFGKTPYNMNCTNQISDTIVRLPLWIDNLDCEKVIDSTIEVLNKIQNELA